MEKCWEHIGPANGHKENGRTTGRILVLAWLFCFQTEPHAFADSYFNIDGRIYQDEGFHYAPEECPRNIIGPSRHGGPQFTIFGGCIVNAGPMSIGTTPGTTSLLVIQDPGTHLLAESVATVPSSRAKIVITDGAKLSITDGSLLTIGNENSLFIGGSDAFTIAPAGILEASGLRLDAGGRLFFTQSDDIYTFDIPISGEGLLDFHGTGLARLTADSSRFEGLAIIQNAPAAVSVSGQLGGHMEIAAGRLQGNGSVGSVFHRPKGVIAPGDDDAIGTLTINGDYHGEGGLLDLDAVLGGDGSRTDMLVITGNSVGTTRVRVSNAGGAGAQTTEGIKIIDVLGTSTGLFSLRGDYTFEGEPAVIAGAYAYQLRQNGITNPADGDWYLRSTYIGPVGHTVIGQRTERSADAPMHIYQPGVPLYEAHPQTLLALSELPTFLRRTRNRQWSGTNEESSYGIWGRSEGQHRRGEAHFTSSITDIEVNVARFQIGAEQLLYEDEHGNIAMIGLTGQLGKAWTDVRSMFGHGNIGSLAYGAGATLTFSGANGTYGDLQAQINRFNSKMVSDTLGTLVSDNKGWGYALGAELGKQIPIGRDLSLTPQVRVHYTHVDFDSFVDPRGAKVSASNSSSLVGAVGIGIDQNHVWLDKTGNVRRTHVYGLANIDYEFFDGTSTTVSHTAVSHLDQKVAAGLGIGGSYHWNDEKLSVYGELMGTTVLSDRSAYSMKGIVGLSMKF